MFQSLILMDALSSAYWENKRKKKKKRNDWGAFFPLGLDTFCLLCCSGFSWMLVVIKG
jgi:hypothetical protein